MQSRFLGCLLGGAVGDALGAPVEFMSRAAIVQRFGPQGITACAPAYGGIGTITDDTQMTLFTAEGLLRGWVRGQLKGITSLRSTVGAAYQRWLSTQGECPGAGKQTDEPGWLIQQRALHSQRAPGNTCLAALRQMSHPGEPARNDSKGCGGVMRVAPVGLFMAHRTGADAARRTFELGRELAALTHGHPTGSLTAGVLAVLVRELVRGAALDEALETSTAQLRVYSRHEETLQAVERARALAANGLARDAAIAELGEGWVAEEALAISIYCALVAQDFGDGVVLAVNHDGDSDSTGAIAGNLLGAMLGVQAIGQEWLQPLELRDVIEQVAMDLYCFRDWRIGGDGEDEGLSSEVWRKYPGY